ncbi:hypothetical protein ISN45_Aa06g030740 [Arabidopsis thaliana x Arabidopsis arenosa]|uniref:Uncharacterized protein n=1 Tax=Arabidopsis thaliana x Arabidopsis arenosa TaxID=1240361 RepID=A0A8T1Z2F2_9BRAS|nr:hypothetical protein ISN45_Aa06g030740 [Arabidopsis thaliana x Arabidopsis arenosa]
MGSVFNVFLSSVMKEMKKTKIFEWKKLVKIGAQGVANHLQYEQKLVVKPEVLTKEEGFEVLDHRFIAETSKFHYIRDPYGKNVGSA